MASYENSTSKRQKFQIKDNFTSSVSSCSDRINDLPEHLLSEILSLLPTKEALKTSVLSKRWRFLWTTISNLDFSDDEVYDFKYYDDEFLYDEGYDDKGYNDVRINFFTSYVNRVLLLLKPASIHKFSIFLDRYSDLFHINMWISTALVRNVRHLKLSLDGFLGNPVDVPCSVFHCKTLEVLRLTQGVLFNIPQQESVCFPNLKFPSLDSVDICGIPAKEGSVCFPKLETLHLIHVKFVGDDDSITNLMRNCPVLEDLLINRAVRDNISNTDMCIPALRSSELIFHRKASGCKVVIDAPLKYLKIINWNPCHEVLVKKPDSLIEAELMIVDDGSADYLGEQWGDLFKLIKVVDKAIKASNTMLPLFCNLIRLEVTLKCKDMCVLQCLLNNSNNLQILVIKKDRSLSNLGNVPPCPTEETWWTELSPVPKCLLTSLKRVEIHGVNGCTDELAMIKDMLKYAKILKNLTIEFELSDEGDIHKKCSLLQKILMFPRASAVCKLNFFEVSFT